jgi:hypothetical protein
MKATVTAIFFLVGGFHTGAASRPLLHDRHFSAPACESLTSVKTGVEKSPFVDR